ncbi:MAG: nicotinate-nicotinamide nucleotide adenylyltransferase [Fervidobacterium sp.]
MVILSGLKVLNSFSKSDTCVIFGGSFNPPHVAHTIVLSYAIDVFNADFYVLPTKTPPHKDVNIPFSKRFEWTEKSFSCFEKIDNVFIWDLEKYIEGVNYAIRNVEEFSKYYKNIVLLVGEDALGNIENWYEYKRIFDMAFFAVYPRTRNGELYERGKRILGDYYSKVIELKNFPLLEISSSDIRKRIIQGKSIHGMVNENIIDDVVKTFSENLSGGR